MRAMAWVQLFLLLALPVIGKGTGLLWKGESLPHRWLVWGQSAQTISLQAEVIGARVEHQLRYLDASVLWMTSKQSRQLLKLNSQLKMELDLSFSIAEYSAREVQAPLTQEEGWGTRAVGLRQALPTSRGEGVKVCIVDTGVNKSHPDLQRSIIGGENFFAESGSPDPSQWQDDNGHGTHVAGIIAARDNAIGILGVAPRAGIWVARVLGKNGRGTAASLADGIVACRRQGAQVINLSIASVYESELVRESILAALEQGILVIAAAGNLSGEPVLFPARIPGVIAVTAMDSNFTFAKFSNFGEAIQFTGPGVEIVSTDLNSTYRSRTGTSMAAPFVSGVAALMIAAEGDGLRGRPLGWIASKEGRGLIQAPASVLNRRVSGF